MLIAGHSGKLMSVVLTEFLPATDLIIRFVEANLLTEITRQARYRVYRYFPYVRLFSDVGR
jgi:hypothetical protein